MLKIKEWIAHVKGDKKVGSRLFLITVSMALFVLALVIRGDESGSRFIVDKSGNIVAIQRESLATSEEYDLNLEIINGQESSERSVRINKQANSDDTVDESADKDDIEAEREAEITGIITNIELSEDERINLPARLSDGSRLKWSIKEKAVNTNFIFIPLMYIALVILVIKSSVDSVRDTGKEIRQSIIMGMPRFSNQLLLMMNAGMILSDAIERISNSYRILGEENMGFFEHEMAELADKNMDHRTSTATLINDLAAKYNVKELMRISTILTENERRGSDVIDNLERESRYLWDDRKIIARERGRMIDTKMSYPLAILLFMLIVITMAPAMMNL